MSPRRALQAILAIAVAGMLFSGTLTYRELFGSPAVQAVTGKCTPLGQPGTILGYPPCVYGLIMYTVLVVIASLGLRSTRAGGVKTPSETVAGGFTASVS